MKFECFPIFRPVKFDSKEAEIQWEKATATNALKFKTSVESGEYIPDFGVSDPDAPPEEAIGDTYSLATQPTSGCQWWCSNNNGNADDYSYYGGNDNDDDGGDDEGWWRWWLMMTMVVMIIDDDNDDDDDDDDDR